MVRGGDWFGEAKYGETTDGKFREEPIMQDPIGPKWKPGLPKL